MTNEITWSFYSYRCSITSTLNKATLTTTCDYKCHPSCEGCTQPYSIYACRKCAFAKLSFEGPNQFICIEKCPQGYEPDQLEEKLCKDINECHSPEKNTCQKNNVCINTIGSYRCECQNGFVKNGIFCDGKLNFKY